MVYVLRIIVLFVLVDFAIPAIFNGTLLNKIETKESKVNGTGVKPLKTRRKERSTSSSSKEKKEGTSNDHSLELSVSDSSSDVGPKQFNLNKAHKYKPKSSKERTGWRKWHRKCTPCPDDMRMKWRDPNIKWICGGYQRARRSFKSLCMMHYRNCQDGTMFTKIADHRCANASKQSRHGEHFFYDYKAALSVDSSSPSSESSSASSETETEVDTGSWNSADIEKAMKYLNNNKLN